MQLDDFHALNCGVWGSNHSCTCHCAAPHNQIASVSETVPVAEIVLFGGDVKEVAWTQGKMPEVGTKLYTRPAAAQPSRAEVLETWQPIETAPKTGRTLLLGYPNVLGRWRTVCGQWISEAHIAENWEEPDDAEAGWYETSAEADDIPNCWPVTPTHWMPPPPAPEVNP